MPIYMDSCTKASSSLCTTKFFPGTVRASQHIYPHPDTKTKVKAKVTGQQQKARNDDIEKRARAKDQMALTLKRCNAMDKQVAGLELVDQAATSCSNSHLLVFLLS
jgi:hypothetical protein